MNKFLWLLSAGAIFWCQKINASVGGENGNGGDAVVCRNSDGSIQRAEQADYYEARIVRGIRIDLGEPSMTWQNKTEMALERLARLDPIRAEQYRRRISEFLNETTFVAGNELPDLPDTGGIVVPTGCKIEQVAIQKTPKFPEDKRYIVNKDIWEHYDNTSKAGIVLHEIIYREALSFLAINSEGSRYFNSLIASQSFTSINLWSYVQRLVGIGIYSFSYLTRLNGQPFSIEIPLAHIGGSRWERKWVSDVTFVGDWILVDKTNSDSDLKLPNKYKSVFNNNITRNDRGFRPYHISIPGLLMTVGSAGFILRDDGLDVSYRFSNGNSIFFDRDQSGEVLSFDGNGFLENEAILSCSEGFFNRSPAIYGDDFSGDSFSLSAGTYYCRTPDGAYSMELLPNSSIVFKRARTTGQEGIDQNDPKYMTGVLIRNLKSMNWQIFGRSYAIHRKGTCVGEHNYVALWIDTKKRNIRLAENPAKSCHSVQEIP